ncbi:MAG: hypothetical protein IJQ90_04180 [Alphaproteobacteria bacterium]|nr:hypothetical protein [Alphaproteobacteria bacterium]
MIIKPHHKRRAFWTFIVTIGIIAIGLLVAPNFINLNKLRPHLESAIFAQTGVNLKINGNVNFGFLGTTHIITHDIQTPNGHTDILAVNLPFSSLFDLENAKLGTITVYRPYINLHSLSMLQLKYHMAVNNATLHFMGKDYKIIRGVFYNGTFDGQVRTSEHKYDISFKGNDFTVTNKNLKLNITGEYFPSGGAAGILEINTNKINSWFGFSEPNITHNVKLTTNFYWDGGYGFKFTDIVANNLHGDVTLEPNGWRTINVESDNISFDFSFLSKPSNFAKDTTLKVDFYGDLVFNNHRFEHVQIDAVGVQDYIQINKIIADSTSFTGGTIDKDGAHEIMIRTILDDKKTECLFSGTENNFECQNFVYGDITGNLKYKNRVLEADISSNRKLDLKELESYIKRIGAQSATIRFKFANMGGVFTQTKKSSSIKYDYIYDKTLSWLNPHMKSLPAFMMDSPGNMVWSGDSFSFTPNTNDWSLTLHDNFFYITGQDIKKWFPDLDLRVIHSHEYIITGFYNDKGDVSDLTIKIAGHTFTGTADKRSLTLHTDKLYIDVFLTPEFFERYEELEFLTNSPLLLPFEFSTNIYLTADTLIYGENSYKNFVYSLKSGTQTFSITDNARGNLLATIIKERSTYDIFIQLNKFVINGKLLPNEYPLNIMDTSITAEINLKTHGHIAHDIKYNMTGDMDLTFDGGYITGIGIDQFYMDTDNLTRLNVEDRIMIALESGTTRLKNMRVIGEYQNGNFTTTKPIELSIRHATAVGMLDITDNAMNAKFDINMRAVAPDSVTVSLKVAPNGRRGYSISELMRYFDPAFMRSFIKTHDKF